MMPAPTMATAICSAGLGSRGMTSPAEKVQDSHASALCPGLLDASPPEKRRVTLLVHAISPSAFMALPLSPQIAMLMSAGLTFQNPHSGAFYQDTHAAKGQPHDANQHRRHHLQPGNCSALDLSMQAG